MIIDHRAREYLRRFLPNVTSSKKDGRMKKRKKETYLDNSEFLDFVLQEFKTTMNCATVEELTEFAFGSFEEAKKAFKRTRIRIP